MDTSEKYIKMCEQAHEIQKQLKDFKYEGMKAITSPSSELFKYIGFYFFRSSRNGLFCAREIDLHKRLSKDASFENYLPNDIWLPRQDQLQEMVIDNFKNYKFSIFALLEEFYNLEKNFIEFDRSLEQAWLAFVMKEKFGKQWIDKKEKWEFINA